jgi:hypothetical protein
MNGPELPFDLTASAAPQLSMSGGSAFKFMACVELSKGRYFPAGKETRQLNVLIDETKLDEQLSSDLDGSVRSIYLLLAHAQLPNNMTVRPHGHGYISRELRFEIEGRWDFSAVLNQSWVLWYFRRPVLAALEKNPEDILSIFPTAQLTGQSEVKLRIHDQVTAYAVLGWVTQNC